MKIFYENNIDVFKRLEQFVPIVSRVHGTLHPEIKEVQVVFNEILKNIKLNLSVEKEFETLRIITTNYLVPNDVCESYEAVYNMLKTIDDNYFKR